MLPRVSRERMEASCIKYSANDYYYDPYAYAYPRPFSWSWFDRGRRSATLLPQVFPELRLATAVNVSRQLRYLWSSSKTQRFAAGRSRRRIRSRCSATSQLRIASLAAGQAFGERRFADLPGSRQEDHLLGEVLEQLGRKVSAMKKVATVSSSTSRTAPVAASATRSCSTL